MLNPIKMCVRSPKAGSAQSLYCSGVQTAMFPVWNKIKMKMITYINTTREHRDLECFLLAKSVSIHTRHVNHLAVAVLLKVPCFTVDAACSDAVRGKVFRVHGTRLAISPRRWEVLKLKEWTARFPLQCISTQDYIKYNNASLEQQKYKKKEKKGGQQADKTQHKCRKHKKKK